MMPAYTATDLAYAPLGEGAVWVDSRSTFTAHSLRKMSDPGSVRQEHFQRQVMRLSQHLGTRRIPIFIHWPRIGRKRLDKGCIGHAYFAGFLSGPQDSPEGYVTHIEIAGADVPDA